MAVGHIRHIFPACLAFIEVIQHILTRDLVDIPYLFHLSLENLMIFFYGFSVTAFCSGYFVKF